MSGWGGVGWGGVGWGGVGWGGWGRGRERGREGKEVGGKGWRVTQVGRQSVLVPNVDGLLKPAVQIGF